MPEPTRVASTPVAREASERELEDWPTCSHCRAWARWSVACAEDGDLNNPTTSAFACRRHLSYVLEHHDEAMTGMDQAVVIDLFENGRE
jgi:hypothetical protein